MHKVSRLLNRRESLPPTSRNFFLLTCRSLSSQITCIQLVLKPRSPKDIATQHWEDLNPTHKPITSGPPLPTTPSLHRQTMAILSFLTVLTAALPLANAHFGLEYPPWRFNTLAGDAPASYSQWNYPCAGVPSNVTGNNVTDWPLDGGSLVLDLHHPWTYLFVNLGVQINPGSTVSNFNMSLSGQTFWNVTGNGTLCIEKLQLPDGFKPKDGDRASIQVVTTDSGSALYNVSLCRDDVPIRTVCTKTRNLT